MTMRVQEIHPMLVHYPLALLPVSIGADALGVMMGSKKLLATGEVAMVVGATSAVLAGLSGLVAQEEVNLKEEDLWMLQRHRNLNLLNLGVTSGMCLYRLGKERPGKGYLLLGMAAMGTLFYGGYLGGQMVYQKGAGVQPAGGVREEETPFLKVSQAGRVLKTLGRHLKEGIIRTLKELRPESPFDVDEVVEGMKEELRADEWRGEGGMLGL